VPGAARAAKDLITTQLEEMSAAGLLAEEVGSVVDRITPTDSLDEAVVEVSYVQESIFEKVELKQQLYTQLNEKLSPTAVVGSSTSGIPASAFVKGLTIAPRVLIVHPVNPPYLVPVVELVPSPATSPDVVAFASVLMEALGQSVVHVRKEVEGFVLNRLQGALLREAWALVEDGVATCADIDATVKNGLGWRWSFMGPFETIDLNAPGGVADYAKRLGGLYLSIDQSRDHSRPWSQDLIDDIEKQRRGVLSVAELPARRAWRDRQLMQIAARHAAENRGTSSES
jgi:3-hydroxyacyl-CoA dehydrogenase